MSVTTWRTETPSVMDKIIDFFLCGARSAKFVSKADAPEQEAGMGQGKSAQELIDERHQQKRKNSLSAMMAGNQSDLLQEARKIRERKEKKGENAKDSDQEDSRRALRDAMNEDRKDKSNPDKWLNDNPPPAAVPKSKSPTQEKLEQKLEHGSDSVGSKKTNSEGKGSGGKRSLVKASKREEEALKIALQDSDNESDDGDHPAFVSPRPGFESDEERNKSLTSDDGFNAFIRGINEEY